MKDDVRSLGQSASVMPGRSFPVSAGSYVVTGKPATLRAAKVLKASAGSFVLNVTTIGLQAGHVIKAVSGAFVVTGKPTAELHSYVILAAPGVFHLYPNRAAGPLYATHIFPGDATFADGGPGAATFTDVDMSSGEGDFIEDGPADASVNPAQVADRQRRCSSVGRSLSLAIRPG
jgi:hypothetical protein